MHSGFYSPCQCGWDACLFNIRTSPVLLLQNVLWQLDDYLQSSKKAPADTSFRVEVCSAIACLAEQATPAHRAVTGS
jgi:hypothetical protein